MSDFDMIRELRRNDERLRQTEVKETIGGVGSFTSFYDSGTFSPVFAGSGGGGSYTQSVSLGEWIRIANTVHVWIRCTMATFTSAPAGNLWITTLPFTSRNTTNAFYALAVGYRVPTTIVTAVIPANSTRVEFYDSAGAIIAASTLSASSFIIVGGAYPV